MTAYEQYLHDKSQCGADSGFEPIWIPDFLFDFQKFLVEWAIRKGRCAWSCNNINEPEGW